MPAEVTPSALALLRIRLYAVLAAICLIIITVWVTPHVQKLVSNPTIVEQTISEVNALSLDSNAVTYTYLVDPQTTMPLLVGNSVGYPINPVTGKVAAGTLINIIDKDGNRYPTWRSSDGTLIVTQIKLHHDGWTDQGEQVPIARFDTVVQTNPATQSTSVNIVPKK